MDEFMLSCPVPVEARGKVTLAHGSGGRMMQKLISKVFASTFPALQPNHDAAVLELGNIKIAFTTDSFVVDPIFFPGGDIGSLAVHGTVNDLAMMGAMPKHLSVAMIIEEGFSLDDLTRITASMQRAATRACVDIVTGDTKVVERGHGHKIYINTTGVGIFDLNTKPCTPERIVDKNVILLLGDIGRHGTAIMVAREGLTFDPPLESDSAPLNTVVRELLTAGVRIACMRDITRGGLASGLCELAQATGLHFTVEEKFIPVTEGVHAACELLGLDPMHVANEGRCIAFLPKEDAKRALDICKRYEAGENAAIIGCVSIDAEAAGSVTMHTAFGGERIVEMLSGDQLPRIC